MNRMQVVLTAAVCGLALPAAAQESAPGVEAVSVPSKDVRLAFVVPGKVAEVAVEQGQRVEAGQLLVRLDDAAEQKRVEYLKNQSEDQVRIRAAEARLEQARNDLRRTEELHAKNVATKYELQHAQLEETIQELSLDLQKFDQEQAKLQYDEEKLKLRRMRLVSPFAGRVERIAVEEGQVVNAHDAVLRLVQTDPLWVDAPVPLETIRSRQVRVGRIARIAYPDGKTPAAAGKVIDVATVADPASDTLTVRVEVPNGQGTPAGQRVFVTFPTPPERAAATGDADRPAPRATYAARPDVPAAADPQQRSD